MARYRLEEVAPICQGAVPENYQYWLLNLDAVESNTGRVLEYVYVDHTQIGASTIAFDESNVLYSKLRPYLNKVVLPERPGYATSEMLPLKPNSKVITREYLTYFLRSPSFVEYINGKTSGAKMPRANISDLKAVEIDCPSIKEQKEVVSSLAKLEYIVRRRQQLLSALDDLIKARFVEMFGECRESISAGDLMHNMRNGVSPSTSGKHQEKVLTLSAITQGQFDPNMWKDGIFDAIPAADKRICSTDFYMCRGNGNKSLVGAGVYSADDRGDLVFPDTVIAASVHTTRVCLPYLFVAWMQPGIREQIEAGARTTNGTYKINQQIISKIKVPLPPLPEQQQFATFVAQVDKSKSAIQKSLDETQLLFDSLMQQYFG